MRLTRPALLAAGLAIAATSLAAPAAVAAASADAATTGTLSCTVADPLSHYKNNWRNVSGTVNDNGTLLSATVTRTVSGTADITSTSPTLDNSFWNGYFLQHHGWNTWVLGTAQAPDGQNYWVLLPATPQPTGTPFSGEVMVGQGSPTYQQELTCTVK